MIGFAQNSCYLNHFIEHSRWQVTEINVTDDQMKEGGIRVLEVRKMSEQTPPGTILEVCRKGYQRENKTIRPVDVITSA